MTSNADLIRRMGDVEAKLDTTSETMIRHVAGCEKLGQAALEARDRMEKNLLETRTRMEVIGSELTVKLDRIMSRQNEQDGALKAGKALYAALGVIGALAIWITTHFTLIK